jgi:hypothetical protein
MKAVQHVSGFLVIEIECFVGRMLTFVKNNFVVHAIYIPFNLGIYAPAVI